MLMAEQQCLSVNGKVSYRYKEARRQGIQPAGTTMDKIIAAEKASENLGRAYNAEKDPNAKTIDKKTAMAINEVKKAGI